MPVTKTLLQRLDGMTTRQLGKYVRDSQRLLSDTIGELERRIMVQTEELMKTKGTRLEGARTNLKQAQQVHRDLTKIFNETYGDGARQVVKGFNKVAGWITDNFKELDITAEFTGADRDMIAVLQRSTMDEFRNYGLAAQRRIQVALYQHVAAMAPFAELQREISAALTGRLAKNGRPLNTYAKQYAFDSTMNFHRAVSVKKADDLGMSHFRFAGAIVQDSREFCVRRAGRVFTKETIESWTYKWGGKSGPALTHQGGHNCRHKWFPVDPRWLSDAEKNKIDTLGPKPETKEIKKKKPKQVPKAKVKPKPKPKPAAKPKPVRKKPPKWQKNVDAFNAKLESFGGKVWDKDRAIELGEIVNKELNRNVKVAISKLDKQGDVLLKKRRDVANRFWDAHNKGQTEIATRLGKELDLLNEKVLSISNRTVAARQRAHRVALKRFRSFGPPTSQKHLIAYKDFGEAWGPTTQRFVGEAQKSFPSAWLTNDGVMKNFGLEPGHGRAYYDPRRNLIAFDEVPDMANFLKGGSALHKQRSAMNTMIHELSHKMEDQYVTRMGNATGPSLVDLEKEFWEHRRITAPADKRRLKRLGRGYGEDEQYVKDKWPSNYMGKWYRHEDAWEVLSMGIPAATGFDPLLWAKCDKELKSWLLGILTGV